MASRTKPFAHACLTFALATLVLALAMPRIAAADQVRTSVDFFDSVGSADASKILTDATIMEENTSTAFVTYTHLGFPTDATSIENMYRALDWIEYCNSRYRKMYGLSELKVSDTMMASAQRNANFSSEHFLSGKPRAIAYTAENLVTTSAGMVEAYKMWFDHEKDVWDDAVARDESLARYENDASGLQRDNPELYNTVGHYLNIVNPEWDVTGIGINTSANAGTVQQFTTAQHGGTPYTVEEYRARLTEFCPREEGQPDISIPKSVARLSGATRYDTMSAIVSAGFTSSVYAIVATGDNYPDALAASSLAGVLRCPVLLTGGKTLSAQTRTQLERLGVQAVYVLGGKNAVSTEVVGELEAMDLYVTILSGDDREETSLAIFECLLMDGGRPDTAIIARGSGFADSLSIGPWSYASGSPILLANSQGRLSDGAVDAIKAAGTIRRIVIVGGKSAVGDDVLEQLGDGYEYVRLAGENRYETSKNIAIWEVSQGLSWKSPSISTGRNFPDALAGSAFVGSMESVLLLTDGASGPAFSALSENKAAIRSCYLFGGTRVLGADVEQAVEVAIK